MSSFEIITNTYKSHSIKNSSRFKKIYKGYYISNPEMRN